MRKNMDPRNITNIAEQGEQKKEMEGSNILKVWAFDLKWKSDLALLPTYYVNGSFKTHSDLKWKS